LVCFSWYRFDARGYLSDIKRYEPNKSSNEELNQEEIELEQLCDKERYADLDGDVNINHGISIIYAI
jgi:hypothetical protein